MDCFSPRHVAEDLLHGPLLDVGQERYPRERGLGEFFEGEDFRVACDGDHAVAALLVRAPVIPLDHADAHAIDHHPAGIAVVREAEGVPAGGAEGAYESRPEQPRLSLVDFNVLLHGSTKQNLTDKGFGEVRGSSLLPPTILSGGKVSQVAKTQIYVRQN